MGILDVIKRWFGGGKSAPVNPAPQTRTSTSVPNSSSSAPAVTPIPVPLTATEALDVIAANRANAKPGGFVERREKSRVNARDGTRVLVIDDSPTIVALLKRMLEQNGYKAEEAVDAETGVVMAISDTPDLIFLDIVLPGMNGFEALRRLRRDPATKTVPIVMISGNELATEQFYAQRIGADDFMKKPFSRSEVFARIERLLDAEKVPRRHLAVVKPVPIAEGDAPASAASPVATTVPASVPAATATPAAPAPARVIPAPAPMPATASAPVVAAAATAIEAPDLAEQVSASPVAETVPAAKKPAVEAGAPESAAVVPAIPPPATTIEEAPAPEAVAADAVAAADSSESSHPPVTGSSEADSESEGRQEPIAPDSADSPADTVAQAIPSSAPDTPPTLIIEETLQAPTPELSDSAPNPLAAVANVATPAASHSNSETQAIATAPVAATGSVSTVSSVQASIQQAAAN